MPILLSGSIVRCRADSCRSYGSIRRRFHPGLPLVMVLAVTAAVPAHAQTAGDDRLEDVVVTARKRSENLQEVPVSITAYGAADLQAQSLARLADLGQMTPNFFYGQKVQSGSSAGEIYIRGVGQQDTQTAFNPSVGLYVDGVYIARATADDLDMADVQRLEVLYGPQGTLFGKNTNGGAVNIQTRLPDYSAARPTGTLEIDGGGYRRLDALGSINVPLVADTMALELTAARRSQEGYSERIDGEDQANQNRTSGRAQLRVKLADGLEAILRLDGTHLNERSAAYKLVEVRTGSPVPVAYGNDTPYRYDDQWVTGSDFSYDGTGPNRNAGHVWGASLTLASHQPWADLKSITAYRTLDIESDFDPDGSPLSVLDVFNHVQQHQVSQELQASGKSASGWIDWVSGLYYFREVAQDDQPANVALEVFGGAANFDPRLAIVNQNYAAYGQANLHLTPKLTLNLGARAGNDQAEVGRIQVDYPVATVEQPYVARSASWNSLLPRAGLTYQWTADLMTYLSASEGSKSGGFNGRAGSIAEFNQYEPERVWTYEAGLRSDWWERRLRFNATVYYSNYKDFQILLNRSVSVDGIPTAFSFVGNMPRASIRGGEAALSLVPVAGLRISAGLGITDGRYEEILPGAPVTLQSQFVDTPRVGATASAEYTLALAAAGEVTARVDYSHKTRIQFDYGNSPLVSQPGYGLLNARLTWQPRNSGLSLYVFGTNLTDVHYAVGGIDDGASGSLGEVTLMMGAPREWGVGGIFRF